jgi:hypothetical protein
MGKTKEILNLSEYSEEEILEQIQLKLNVEHQYYVNIYEKSLELSQIDKDENKN